MIKITFTEPETPEWKKWKDDAQAAVQELKKKMAKGEAVEINANLYKRMRQVLYDAFHGKCAYCERKFVLDQSGDIDHFRPKGAVTDERDQVVRITMPGGGSGPHPGYYWLAYDWRNLLPTCARCNRPARLQDGRLVGKSTRFPVQGQHQWEPGKEEQEAPMFLNPVFDDPQAHLGISMDTGVIYAKSPRGQTCIDLLDLNREGLPEERQKRYTEIKARVTQAWIALRMGQGQTAQEVLKLVQAYQRGEEELSWAAQEGIREERPFLNAILQLLESPRN
jgi:5-methylcytosine-specific restriction endonuclease McrA